MRINFYAPFNFDLGYGIHGTNLALAMEGEGLDVRYIPTERLPETVPYKAEEFKALLEKEVSPDSPSISLTVGSLFDRFYGKPRIGYTVLEVDLLPDSWAKQMNALDAVWVPTHWGKEVYEKSGVKVPISVVPEGIDPEVFNPYAYPIQELVERNTFKFLCIGKLENRKNINMLCQAFAEEFNKKEDVELILQATNPFVNIDIWQYLYSLGLPKHRPIIPVNRFPNPLDLPRLYISCDTFVMPTRGEGWGLPFLEAMACGLPTIGTNWSGNTEFMNEKNAYMLKYDKLVKAEDPIFGQFLEQGKWAEPSKKHLKELMRYVYENQREARKKGQKASKEVRKGWSWEKAAKKAKKELEAISH